MTSPHTAPDRQSATPSTTDLVDLDLDQKLTANNDIAITLNEGESFNPSALLPKGQPIPRAVYEEEALLRNPEELSRRGPYVEPAIPQSPPSDGGISHHMRLPNMSIEQMEALSAMLSYSGPSTYGDTGSANMGLNVINGVPLDNSLMAQNGYPASSPYPYENTETRISAYAMLEFDDGQFYMNTYSVILGRDLVAARAAMRRDEEEQHRISEGAEPKTPIRIKREDSRYTKSVMSESGGILREGSDSDSGSRSKRRKHRKASRKSKSTGSSSQDGLNGRNGIVHPGGKINYQPQSQARRHAHDEDKGAKPVDYASLRPSPHDCPLVGIHPPAATPAAAYKAISRRHVKIAYNVKKNFFEAQIIGRNGAFVDDKFYYHNDVIPLKSGSALQIGGVVVKFILPEVAPGQTGTEHQLDYEEEIVKERYSEGGKEMSFEFEDTPREGALMKDTSDEESEDGNDSAEPDIADNEDSEEGANGEEGIDEDDDDLEDGIRPGDMSDENAEDGDEAEGEIGNHNAEEIREPLQRTEKRKGPGRPPKNGVMSKREQRLLQKEAQQKAAKSIDPGSGSGPTEKNKVGRPRKHPQGDSPPIKTEKRKYTKRKPKDPDAIVKREGSGDDQPVKEKKEKKSVKPPRSPSPVFNEADLTPDQLAKPQANYVTLIHEALSNSETGQMSLPQIYRAIQRKYPFFVLKCNTNGWQSSVRHNLSQHTAFRKVERDGKGWMWAIVDGVSIEKEKKRRPTPPLQVPPQYHQPIYRAGPPPPHMMPGHLGMMGPPHGYMTGGIPPNLRPGQPAPYAMPGQPLMNGYSIPPHGYPSQGPPPQSLAAQPATYSSPYAPKPPANQTLKPQPQGQSQPLPQPSNLATDHRHSGPLPQSHHQQSPMVNLHTAQAPQGPQIPVPPGRPPPMNELITRAIETFRIRVIASLKGQSNNAEAVVASAVNRVLGNTNQSTVPGDPHEEKIIATLRNIIAKVKENNGLSTPVQQGGPSPGPPQPLPQAPPQGSLSQAPQQGMPQALPQGLSQAPPQGLPTQIPAPQIQSQGTPTPGLSAASISSRPPTPASSVPRPPFSGQGFHRPSVGGIPRPPMMPPAIGRKNSGSPIGIPPQHSVPLSSTASPALISTPSPAPSIDAVPPTGNNISIMESNEEITDKFSPSPVTDPEVLNDHGKRLLDEADMGGTEQRESKRLGAIEGTLLKA